MGSVFVRWPVYACNSDVPANVKLTCDMLVACASQHGMHGVAHLVEEVFHHAWGEQGGGVLGGVRQAQHQHHDRQLVLARFLTPTATTNGEVTVLAVRGGGWYG